MFLVQPNPIVWYNSAVKTILSTVAVLSACASANAADVALRSHPPPDAANAGGPFRGARWIEQPKELNAAAPRCADATGRVPPEGAFKGVSPCRGHVNNDLRAPAEVACDNGDAV